MKYLVIAIDWFPIHKKPDLDQYFNLKISVNTLWRYWFAIGRRTSTFYLSNKKEVLFHRVQRSCVGSVKIMRKQRNIRLIRLDPRY